MSGCHISLSCPVYCPQPLMATDGDRLPGQSDLWLEAAWTPFSGKTSAKLMSPLIFTFAPVNTYTFENTPKAEISPPFLPKLSYFCYLISHSLLSFPHITIKPPPDQCQYRQRSQKMFQRNISSSIPVKPLLCPELSQCHRHCELWQHEHRCKV